jgi:hypothetical protein
VILLTSTPLDILPDEGVAICFSKELSVASALVKN